MFFISVLSTCLSLSFVAAAGPFVETAVAARTVETATFLVVRVRTQQGVVRLPIEDYLKGVLPSEMPARWPLEALKAQAVAARSYVMKKMRLRAHKNYDVDDSTQDQVYNPDMYNRLPQPEREQIDRAIAETAGAFLIEQTGHVHDAFFHADCGGTNENAQAVWGAERVLAKALPFLKTSTIKQFIFRENEGASLAHDAACELSDKNLWQARIEQRELNQKLRKYFFLTGKKSLHGHAVSPYMVHDVRVAEMSASGRVQNLIIEFSGRLTKLMSTQNFRELFGYTRVKSTHMTFQMVNHALSIQGKGYGHGVGMCQSGARYRALAGETYTAILHHYYPHATLQKAPVSVEKNAPVLSAVQ